MAPKPYHHGALRAALLDAAERILEQDGREALTLRACARAVGVSHAAPAHHFKDRRGLLTALAARGFHRFGHALGAAAASPEAPGAKGEALDALGRAYVRFAAGSPTMFLLMFHDTELDRADSDLAAAGRAAFDTLAHVAAGSKTDAADPAEGHDRALASWCLVHGFAMLMIDDRLPRDRSPEALLEAIL